VPSSVERHGLKLLGVIYFAHSDNYQSGRFAFCTCHRKFLVGSSVFTTVGAEHQQKGWKPMPVLELAEFLDQSSVTARY
jgi:hypothetical protein